MSVKRSFRFSDRTAILARWHMTSSTNKRIKMLLQDIREYTTTVFRYVLNPRH